MYGIQTLANIIITNPTRTDLVLGASHEVTTIIATQTKDDLYHNRYPMDQFLPLTIKIWVLHQQADSFLINVPT
jgi:hypothetical protein